MAFTTSRLKDTAPRSCACVPRSLDRISSWLANSCRAIASAVRRQISGCDPTPPPSTTSCGFRITTRSAIADLVVILNPQLVVLGGGVGSHPEICRLTAEAIARHELASQLEMRSSDLGTQAQLRGAVSLSLEVVNAMLLR